MADCLGWHSLGADGTPTTNSVALVYAMMVLCLDFLTTNSKEEGEGLVGSLCCSSVSLILSYVTVI